MNRVRVVHLCQALEMGGMEKLLVEFARHANRDRFNLSFVSLTKTGQAAKEIEHLGWPVIALNQPAGVRWALSFKLAQILLRNGANILHTHNTRPLLYGSTAARLAGLNGMIHTCHGTRRANSRRQLAMFKFAARTTDRIVSVSDDCTLLSVKQGLPGDKLVTIRNGIDISRFPFAGPNPTGPAVMVGRLSAEKDLPTLLRAFEIVAKKEPSFRLQLVGDGPCASELKQLCSRLNLHDHVQFLGQVADVSSILGAASLFVLSSLTEGISLAILEAMAHGLPVIATRVGGNPEIIDDGKTGLLVPAQSSDRLAAAILKVYRDPSLARAMGIAARQKVESHFDVRRMVAEYESLYRQVVNSEPAFAIPA